MQDLIEALRIFSKYANPYSPTYCEHDELRIIGVSPAEVSTGDKARLDELGFFVSHDDAFMSYRFGSA